MTCPRDGAYMTEDLTFLEHMRAYNLPQRRFACANGHARITDAPAIIATSRPDNMLHARVCERCGGGFESRFNNAKYCSERCRRDPERERGRAKTRQRSKHGRASRRSWGAILALHPTGAPQRPPMADAPRQRGTGGWA